MVSLLVPGPSWGLRGHQKEKGPSPSLHNTAYPFGWRFPAIPWAPPLASVSWDAISAYSRRSSSTSVGEVRSGPVQGHFCWTGDWTVQSLTKFLGPGLRLPWTVYISLVPAQTRSRRSLHYLFIYLFKIEDGRLVWDSAASSSRR